MSKFLDISKEIAEDFLQTAVFIDDKLGCEDQETAVPPANGINEPVGYNTAELKKEPQLPEGQPADVDSFGDSVSGDSKKNLTEKPDYFVNAQNLAGSFMEKGIICSVIQYIKDDSDERNENYIKLIKKADIAVLDWDLYKDDGKEILKIIEEITPKDNLLNELRLIVIYTQKDLNAVKEKILSELGFNQENEFVLHNKYTTISLFSKPGINETTGRLCNPSDLADKCIKEFTEAFRGVVPNVALASVSEIRKNTHRLLGVLNKDLDIGYLSHRALLPSPEDAEKHLEDIIADEIRSIISCNETGKKSCYENICDYSEISDKVYKCKNCDSIAFPLFIKIGAENILSPPQKETLKKQNKGCFTKEWYRSEEKSEKSEILFAAVSSMQTDYSKNMKKFLKLGVIIEHINVNGNVRYLCTQPECDSVRLGKDEETEFMFLELKPSESGKDFDLIFDDGKRYEIHYGRRSRKTISFKPSENEIVEPLNGKFIDELKNEYNYICSLKKSHAQKIANELGAYISRVGLNESEYLRRNRSRR